jgi:hypothetical protein
MPVGLFSVADIFVERFHECGCQLSAVSSQLNTAAAIISCASVCRLL